MKIVYCSNTVCKRGGIEMVTLCKANALARIPDNQVWIVVTEDVTTPVMNLDHVTVVNLGINYTEYREMGLWSLYQDYRRRKRLHRERLEKALNEINPDVVVATGQYEKHFLPTLKVRSNPVFVRELHTARSFRRDCSVSRYEKLKAKVTGFYEYRWKIRAYDKIVVLTEDELTGAWKNWDKVAVIPNPITNKTTELSSCESKIVITAGELRWMKNFEALINIWAKVVQKHADWTLQIWGEGKQSTMLESQIKRLGLAQNVFLKGSSSNMVGEMAKASLFVLTSKSESFSLVTLEAMSVGIPSVVYNCPGGIRYVVEDGKTGFLVPMGDEEAFVEKVCTLIEDTEMRKEMGAQALKVSEKYAMDKVIEQWMELFRDLCQKKKGNK